MSAWILGACFVSLISSACTFPFKEFGTDTDPYANLTSIDDLLNVLIRRDCMKVHCLGKGCEPVTEKGGCQICLCPTGTAARGCDKMPPFMQGDLFWRGCPNDTDEAARTITRYPATKVYRWYRNIDKKQGLDECRSYPFPKCEDDLDFNLWSSPKTYDECKDICYPKEAYTDPTAPSDTPTSPQTPAPSDTTNPSSSTSRNSTNIAINSNDTSTGSGVANVNDTVANATAVSGSSETSLSSIIATSESSVAASVASTAESSTSGTTESTSTFSDSPTTVFATQGTTKEPTKVDEQINLNL